ncbi:MAG: hypothetical protein GY943_28550 [Chloroflexi bacterium]|nr:hypothetical protein [Chloroflexota bacterium]
MAVYIILLPHFNHKPISSGTFVRETAVCINNQQSTINEQLQTAVSHPLIPKIRCTLTAKTAVSPLARIVEDTAVCQLSIRSFKMMQYQSHKAIIPSL